MNWLVGIATVATCVATLVVWALGRRYRTRWGTEKASDYTVGDGPFRRATVQSWKLRGVPPIVRVTAVFGIVWGIITMVVLVPAGLVFALLLETGGSREPTPAALVVLLALDGAVIAVWMCAIVRPLLKATWTRRAARRFVGWTVGHHLAAVLVTLVPRAMAGESPVLLVISVPAALLGLAHAGLCLHTVGEVERASEGD